MANPERVQLLGLSGSLQERSTNTALLRTAQELAPRGVEIVLHPLHDLPMFNRDLESGGLPKAASALRDAVEAADGLLLASPEYNHSTSGAMKNAIDWASRGKPAPLDEKPVVLLSSAGGSGGSGAQDHLREILAHNRVHIIEPTVQIRRGWQYVEGGRLVSDEHREAIEAAVQALLMHIRSAGNDAG